jgi:hypothetical protein
MDPKARSRIYNLYAINGQARFVLSDHRRWPIWNLRREPQDLSPTVAATAAITVSTAASILNLPVLMIRS